MSILAVLLGGRGVVDIESVEMDAVSLSSCYLLERKESEKVAVVGNSGGKDTYGECNGTKTIYRATTSREKGKGGKEW